MKRSLFILQCMLCLILLVGCREHNGTDQDEGVVRSAQDPTTATVLETSVERTSIGLAERIWVSTSWRWSGDIIPTLDDPDWSEADWTEIERIDSPPARLDDRYTAQRRVLLEPFLPGEYEIPAGVLLITTADSEVPIELTNEAIRVSVIGVLPESDTGELNPIAQPSVPAASDNGSMGMLIIVLIAACTIIALALLLMLRRARLSSPDASVYATLLNISRDQTQDRAHAFSELEQVFDRLDPRLRQTSEFAAMIHACERARYSGISDEHTSPARMARHTLDLLGHAQQHPTPGMGVSP